MSSLDQLNSMPERIFGNVCLSRPVLAIGGTATAVSTTNAIVNAIDGVIRDVAALTNQALAALTAADLPASEAAYLQPSGRAGFYVQPENTVAYYVLVVNAAGAVRVVQGTWRNPTTGETQAIDSPAGLSVRGDGAVPPLPAGVAPFGMFRINTGGTPFTPGTTALTDIATLWDLFCLPSVSRP